AIFAAAGLSVLWWLLRPRRKRRPLPVPDRGNLEQRIDQLRVHGADTGALATELGELDRRRLGARLHVAVFGEISTGKSSLIRALAPLAQLASDARGGTTRIVGHYDSTLPDGRSVVLADVPGSRESGGEGRETAAREEALRAHAVFYLCAGDLTRAQVDELRWLADFGKPLLLALNKADQWNASEREPLLARLRQQSRGIASAVVAISASSPTAAPNRSSASASPRSNPCCRHSPASPRPAPRGWNNCARTPCSPACTSAPGCWKRRPAPNRPNASCANTHAAPSSARWRRWHLAATW